MTQKIEDGHASARYRHEALFYAGEEDFLDGSLRFIGDAVAAEEPILVVVGAGRIAALRGELGPGSQHVRFADMATVGANPARIIPAWQAFVAEYGGSGVRVRGIGEPIWAERGVAELAECERHEALLNAAFDDPDFWLLCPYDTATLPTAVLDEAMRNHPYCMTGTVTSLSSEFPGVEALVAPFDGPLGATPPDAPLVRFTEESVGDVRAFVVGFAELQNMGRERVHDLVLAAHEIAVNAVVHGAVHAMIRAWREGDSLVCEVRGFGVLPPDPLVDRRNPSPDASRGRGLWIANQLCDLVQVRSHAGEVVVRLHVRLT